MTTYFAIVFELKEDTSGLKKKLKKILEKNFHNFAKGVRKSDSLGMYMKEGTKLVIE